MARIRQFKPSFFTDDKVSKLSRDARLFFLGVLSEADDEGRLVDSPKRLAGVVFPFDDDVTPRKVAKWIDELVDQQMVLRYTHEGGGFLYVRKFKDHQKMSHPTPSTLPPPPSGPGQSAGRPPEKLRRAAGEPPEGFAPVFEGVSVSEGVGVSEDRSSSSLNRVAPASADDDDDDEKSRAAARARSVIAARRIDALSVRPANPRAYRSSVLRDVEAEHGGELLRLAALGLTGEAIADAVEPLEPPPAPRWPDFQPSEPEGTIDQSPDHLSVLRTALGGGA